MEDLESSESTQTFAAKRKQFRKRKSSSSESEQDAETEENLLIRLEETKALQKLRKRPKGVSAVGLALGKQEDEGPENFSNDPFKLKTGGMIDMKSVKIGKEVVDELSIGTTFSAETNRRDEDADMMKYIDEQLAKRKGIDITSDMAKRAQQMKAKVASNNTPTSPDPSVKLPEDALYEVPEHLRISSSKKSEEMLSNQMLSGIPEVDLGIEAKIKNIEATEDAKQKLLRERMNKKDGPSQFVPTNMAVNFVQHNRFNIDEGDIPKPKKVKEVKRMPVVVGDGESPNLIQVEDKKKQTNPRDDNEKATDDFHFEKFKKQFRRY